MLKYFPYVFLWWTLNLSWGLSICHGHGLNNLESVLSDIACIVITALWFLERKFYKHFNYIFLYLNFNPFGTSVLVWGHSFNNLKSKLHIKALMSALLSLTFFILKLDKLDSIFHFTLYLFHTVLWCCFLGFTDLNSTQWIRRIFSCIFFYFLSVQTNFHVNLFFSQQKWNVLKYTWNNYKEIHKKVKCFLGKINILN